MENPPINTKHHIIIHKTKFLNNPTLSSRFLNPDLTLDELISIAEDFRGAGPDWVQKGWTLEGYGVYSVTKVLLNSYTRILARNLVMSGSKIRVNCLCPGWVRTNMGGQAAPLSLQQGVGNIMPVVRDNSDVTGKFWTDGSRHEDFS